MSAAEMEIVGRKLPRMRSASFRNGYAVEVRWDDATRSGRIEEVDLAPLIFRMKFYSALRDNEGLLRTVHVVNGGSAMAWGQADEIDMAASSVLSLVEASIRDREGDGSHEAALTVNG